MSGLQDAPGAVLDSYPWAKSWASFLRAVWDREDGSARQVIRNAMSERVPSEGGFLVPWKLHEQVLSYMTSAVVRPRAAVVAMEAARLGLPLLDNPDQSSGKQALGGLTFSVVEAGSAIPATNPQLARMMLEARKVAAYLQGVPGELTEDAAGAMGDLLARVIAAGLAWYEDDLFIANGTGAGEPQSLASAPCALDVTRAGSGAAVLADLTAMVRALHPAALQAGMTPGLKHVRWLLSADAMKALLELYQDVGSPTTQAVTPSGWLDLGDGEGKGPSLLGLPASPTDHQPALGTKGDVILADLSQYVIGDRQLLTVEQSRSGPSFAADASDFRIRSRVDGRYWVQSQTTTEAGQQVSPVVVLN